MVMFFGCANDPEAVKAATQKKDAPVEWADEVTIRYSDHGKQKVFMFAPRLERFASEGEEYTVMPEGIKADFYDSAMVVQSGIRAGYAVDYPGKRTVEARYDVQVVNEKGDSLFTESLTWDREKKMIFTNAPVRIVTIEGEIIYGEHGMESDERFDRWRIRSVRESTLIIKENIDEEK